MGTYNQKSLKILPDPAILPLETYPEKITSNILQPGLCAQTGPGTDPPSVVDWSLKSRGPPSLYPGTEMLARGTG